MKKNLTVLLISTFMLCYSMASGQTQTITGRVTNGSTNGNPKIGGLYYVSLAYNIL